MLYIVKFQPQFFPNNSEGKKPEILNSKNEAHGD